MGHEDTHLSDGGIVITLPQVTSRMIHITDVMTYMKNMILVKYCYHIILLTMHIHGLTGIRPSHVTNNACQLIYLCCKDHVIHIGDHMITCDVVAGGSYELVLQSAINDSGAFTFFLCGVVFGIFLSNECPSCKETKCY